MFNLYKKVAPDQDSDEEATPALLSRCSGTENGTSQQTRTSQRVALQAVNLINFDDDPAPSARAIPKPQPTSKATKLLVLDKASVFDPFGELAAAAPATSLPLASDPLHALSASGLFDPLGAAPVQPLPATPLTSSTGSPATSSVLSGSRLGSNQTTNSARNSTDFSTVIASAASTLSRLANSNTAGTTPGSTPGGTGSGKEGSTEAPGSAAGARATPLSSLLDDDPPPAPDITGRSSPPPLSFSPAPEQQAAVSSSALQQQQEGRPATSSAGYHTAGSTGGSAGGSTGGGTALQPPGGLRIEPCEADPLAPPPEPDPLLDDWLQQFLKPPESIPSPSAAAAAAGGSGGGSRPPALHIGSFGDLATAVPAGQQQEQPGEPGEGTGQGEQQAGSIAPVPRSPGDPPGHMVEPRVLTIFAIPLCQEKGLVFLPITGWTDDPEPETRSIGAKISAGFGKITGTVSNMWNSMKEKDPNSFQHKMYTAGQKVIENMTAEERLMRNIPRSATKVIIYHPAVVEPVVVQEALTKMTANYCLKATGKAAVAGVLLPVAVGLEILAVPGSGWYALYQLYKNSVAASGGVRLKQYLNTENDVRVCYAGDPRLDTYVERCRLSPDGLLSGEDIDELCHDVREPGLHHPLTELRARYLKKYVAHKSDYALLPVNAPDTPSGQGGSAGPQAPEGGLRA